MDQATDIKHVLPLITTMAMVIMVMQRGDQVLMQLIRLEIWEQGGAQRGIMDVKRFSKG
jgi:hypothetical protein